MNMSMSNCSTNSRANSKLDKVKVELDSVTQFRKVLVDDCEINNYEKEFINVVSVSDEDVDVDSSS